MNSLQTVPGLDHSLFGAVVCNSLMIAATPNFAQPQVVINDAPRAGIERHGPIKAWIVDDTGFPKHGTHSVGVHHQYCAQLGKQAQLSEPAPAKAGAAVTLSIANQYASLPIADRLYLPRAWADDAPQQGEPLPRPHAGRHPHSGEPGWWHARRRSPRCRSSLPRPGRTAPCG